MSTVSEVGGQPKKATDTVKSVSLDVLRCDAEIEVTKLAVQKLISDLKSMSQEIEDVKLDRKWSTESCGKGVLLSPEDEASRICGQLKLNPTLLPDVMSLLHKKLNKLRLEAGQLEHQLQSG